MEAAIRLRTTGGRMPCVCRLTGIRPPKCGKILPHFYGRVWISQFTFVILRNKLRRIAGTFSMLCRSHHIVNPIHRSHLQTRNPLHYNNAPPCLTLADFLCWRLSYLDMNAHSYPHGPSSSRESGPRLGGAASL